MCIVNATDNAMSCVSPPQVVGLVESLLLPREYPSSASHGRLSSLLLDMSTSGWQFAVMAALVALHTGLTFQLPVPGCPTGYLGPGGLAENNSHPNCTGGAAMWIGKKF